MLRSYSTLTPQEHRVSNPSSLQDVPRLPSVWLQELTWEETAAYLRVRDAIVIPSAPPNNWSGRLARSRHLCPLSLAEDAARRAGVLAAPPLWYGDSSHHLGFAGPISLGLKP